MTDKFCHEHAVPAVACAHLHPTPPQPTVDNPYPFLSPEFLTVMNDIGRHGWEKYGLASFHARRSASNRERDERTTTAENQKHAAEHFAEYAAFKVHDKFRTDQHQLGAVAFNAMMEYFFARLDMNE